MTLKKRLLPLALIACSAFCVAGLAACDTDSGDETKEPVVEQVTDKVYENFGTFTGTTVDGVPSEGTLVTTDYTYTGTFTDGYRITGTGTMTYNGEDADWFKGTFVNGQLEGFGQCYYKGGYIGIGEWSAGKIDGTAYFVWPQPDGSCDWYLGDWEGQIRSGEGRYQFSNGCWYIGEFKDDWINGEGVFHWTGGNFFDGTFAGGNPVKGTYGFGQMDGVQGYIWVDAETGAWSWYTGELEDGTKVENGQIVTGDNTAGDDTTGDDTTGDEGVTEEPSGPVVEQVTDRVYENFGTFTGTTVDGVPTEGTLVTTDYTYVGTFTNGCTITGTGRKTFNGEDPTWYEGTFVNGELEGYGQVYYTGGCIGIGQWKAGKIDGTAYFVWPQGNGAYDWYLGEWSNQQRSGQGHYQFNNGCWYVGEFANDWINGKGVFHWVGGNYFDGTFENGSPMKGTYGYGQMDGVQGYIWVDAETGAWSWYTGALEDGTQVENGQIVAAE